MKILLLALFISESTCHIRYWTEEEVDLIERELEKFQKKDEDRDAALVSSLTGSVYVLQNKMAELDQDLDKGSEDGSGHLEVAIGSLSSNVGRLRSLLGEAKTLVSEYSAQFEKQAELEKQAAQHEEQAEQERERSHEENQPGLHARGSGSSIEEEEGSNYEDQLNHEHGHSSHPLSLPENQDGKVTNSEESSGEGEEGESGEPGQPDPSEFPPDSEAINNGHATKRTLHYKTTLGAKIPYNLGIS